VTQKEKQKYDIIIKVPVTRDQLEMIHQRMKEAHTDNRAAFIRKMALDGYFLEMDTSPIKEANRLLRSISNNFNQVARRANSTGSIYETDLTDMAQKLNRLWDMQTRLMEKILQTK
jgi:hypothetical protein